MSAMSASPVKPALPPTGVNVPPPVATSPPKVGMMQIPPSLTIAPTKPPNPNMNHTAMPLSLIADHKISQQFPPQSQPPSMQPISQPLSRTPEKPKDLVVPAQAGIPVKPTSNGMEGFPASTPIPMATPALPESITSAVPAPLQKSEPHAPNEVMECNIVPGKVENLVEATAAPVPSSVEPETEKKESVNLKAVEPSVDKPSVDKTSVDKTSVDKTSVDKTSVDKHSVVTETQEPLKIQTTVAAAPTTIAISTLGVNPALTNPTPTPAPNPAASVVVAAPSTKQSTPTPEQTSATPTVSRTEASLPISKPELKVATIPRQATKRKREAKVVPDVPEKKEEKEDDRKSKRVRLPTQPYQSPIPELNIIAKITKSTKATPSKAADDKLIVFYKNEFLAVRNADGGFYVCQAMQNIFKSSPRIRIRWLSQEEGKDTYSPDFYDHTDFDCILTNLNLDKVDKEKYRLPEIEQQRTESILKRALDVEKGVSEKPPVTEEHPDGLDLSLFRDESQLKKSSGKSKEKKSESDKSDDEEVNSTHDEDFEEDEKDEKKMKKGTAPKTSKRKKKITKKKPPTAEKKAATKSSNSGNKSTVQLSKKKAESRLGSKRKSSVSSNSQPPEKRMKKLEVSSQSSGTNKTRSAEATVEVKSRRDRRAKSRK